MTRGLETFLNCLWTVLEYIIQITNVVESMNGKQTLKDVNIKFPILRPQG